jgi:hypothetical protein
LQSIDVGLRSNAGEVARNEGFVLSLLLLASAQAPSAVVEPAAASPVVVADGCLANLPIPVTTREPVKITASEEGGVVTIEVRADQEIVGRRRLEVGAAPCEDQRAAATLAIALALEELGWVRPPDTSAEEEAHEMRDESTWSPPPPAQPAVAAPAEQAPVAVEPVRLGSVPMRRGPLRLGTAVEIGIAAGVTSNSALSTGALVDGGWAPSMAVAPELSVRAGPFVTWPSRMTLAWESGDHDTWMALWGGRLDVCAGVTTESFRARTCGTGVLGVVDGTALAATGHASLGGRAEIGWRTTRRVTLTLSADLLAKLAPTTLVAELDGDDTVTLDEPSPVAVVLATGVSTDFL